MNLTRAPEGTGRQVSDTVSEAMEIAPIVRRAKERQVGHNSPHRVGRAEPCLESEEGLKGMPENWTDDSVFKKHEVSGRIKCSNISVR